MDRNGPGVDEKARVMADLIERWIGNPISRNVLGLITRRGKGKRRTEKILMNYAGMDVDLSFGDRAFGYLLNVILGRILRKTNLPEGGAKEYLRDCQWRKGLASVLEGIVWRGLEKPFTAYSPFLVVWNFTDACNLHCEHCYQEAKGAPSTDEMTTAEALEAVDVMADEGVAYIAMSGGEPLMRRDFFQVAERIRRRDMGFSSATNGTLLKKEFVKWLKDSGCLSVQVSIDGMRETHDRFRGVECFDDAIQGIRNVVDSEMDVGVSMAITRQNLHEVEKIIDLTEEFGAGTFMHFNFIPTGRGKEIFEQDLSPEEREDLLKMLVSESRNRRISLLSTAPQYSRVSAECGVTSLTHFDGFGQQIDLNLKIQFLAEFVGGCGAGRLYLALQPNGDITPCVFIPIKIGNIREDDFLSVWRNSEVLESLRDRSKLKGRCGICPSRNICGGCRARAYSYLDDLQESDPGCPLVTSHGTKLIARDEAL